MKREEALALAVKIGKLIMSGTKNLSRLPLRKILALPHPSLYKDLGWFSEDLKPKVHEILLFGPATFDDASDLDGLDLIMLDNGFYSQIFQNEFETGVLYRGHLYRSAKENLKNLLENWFVYDDFYTAEICMEKVALHIFPLSILGDDEERRRLSEQRRNLDFFRYIFSSTLRFELDGDQTLRRVDLGYFGRRYRADILDLIE